MVSHQRNPNLPVEVFQQLTPDEKKKAGILRRSIRRRNKAKATIRLRPLCQNLVDEYSIRILNFIQNSDLFDVTQDFLIEGMITTGNCTCQVVDGQVVDDEEEDPEVENPERGNPREIREPDNRARGNPRQFREYEEDRERRNRREFRERRNRRENRDEDIILVD